MRLRRAGTRTTWDAVVSAFDEALCFHTWDWLDFQERALGLTFDRYLVEVDGEPVGVVPAMRCAPATLYTPLLPNPFQGPLVPPSWPDRSPRLSVGASCDGGSWSTGTRSDRPSRNSGGRRYGAPVCS